jgi:hypothetical protein
LLADATLVPTFEPDRGAEATPPCGSQAPRTCGLQGPAYPTNGDGLRTRASDDVRIGSITLGGHTAADPYGTSKLAFHCRPVTELEVTNV